MDDQATSVENTFCLSGQSTRFSRFASSNTKSPDLLWFFWFGRTETVIMIARHRHGVAVAVGGERSLLYMLRNVERD